MVYDIYTAKRSVELLGNRKEWGFNFDPANLTQEGLMLRYRYFPDRIYHVHTKMAGVTHNINIQAVFNWKLATVIRFSI